MNPTLKYNLTKTILDNLFKNSDRLCETSNNTEAVNTLFEIKMRMWNELRNLLNACSSEDDIVFLLPEQLKDAASGYSFKELVYYVPSDKIKNSIPLAEKLSASIKEQKILEMLISH